MNTVMNILMEYAVNEYDLTKEELMAGLEKNHIPYTETASGNTKIYNFSDDAIAREYIVAIKESKIVDIYEILDYDNQEIKVYYEKRYQAMYELAHITLLDMAKENCELSLESLKNTIYTMNEIEFGLERSYDDSKIHMKIGAERYLNWQFGIKLKFTSESTVKILSIKDYARKLFLYGKFGDGNE